MSIVGDRLREAMEDRGVDQATLAKAVGVSQGAISLILVGKTQRSKYLLDISLELGVSYDWLTGRSDVKTPSYDGPGAVAREDLALLEHLDALPHVEKTGLRLLIANYGKLIAESKKSVALPPEAALARMFEGLLLAMDRSAPVDEQARLLAQRLPIGLSQLQDLLPETVTPIGATAEAPEPQPTPAGQPR